MPPNSHYLTLLLRAEKRGQREAGTVRPGTC